MGRSKKNKVVPGQLAIPGLDIEKKTPFKYAEQSQSKPTKKAQLVKESDSVYQTNTTSRKIFICVGVTFDPGQGIREFRQTYDKNPIPSIAVFDCRHLELAELYATPNSKELYYPEETYLIGKGGLISNFVFLNFLRCHDTLSNWSEQEYNQTGIRPIEKFEFIPPEPSTHIGKLWNVLGLKTLASDQPQNIWTRESNFNFQSRIVTPFLIVDEDNQQFALKQVINWLDYISHRIGEQTHVDLIQLLTEVVTNLVKHGYRGTFSVAIWPSGQIEILWSNPIEHLKDWPPEKTAQGLAKGLLGSQGAGIKYIYDDLLPAYKGVFVISWKTHHLIFRSGKDFSIMGHKPRSDAYLPRSILFHLHLFCAETRKRS